LYGRNRFRLSWTDDNECETGVANALARSVSNISLVKYDPAIADAQERSVPKESKEKCDPKVENASPQFLPPHFRYYYRRRRSLHRSAQSDFYFLS
jgi:hypothetical protein